MGAYFVFNDPIHGSVELPPLCVKIIDTVQFQRLRSIKQLGMCYFVYPGASHNRFEHSIGTCHLARELLFHLRTHQPELAITEKDFLCVEIAALCHDLGHGPFSHFYDNVFIPEIENDSQWKHEDSSLQMLQHILDKNDNVKEAFNKEGLIERDINFIKNLINPDRKWVGNEEHTGRGVDKDFLYNIVANKQNGVDVDKWDYISRDCHHLGMINYVDHKRIIKFARVLTMDKGRTEICFRDKTALNFYFMFRSRLELHSLVYKHKAVIAINEMLKDAFCQADRLILRQGKSSLLSLSEAKCDMTAYTFLTDSVFDDILHSSDPKLDPAKQILIRILERRLYTLVGTKYCDYQRERKINLCDIVPEEEKELFVQLVICESKLDFTQGNKNPVHNIHFYSKRSINEVLPEVNLPYSSVIPKTFSETIIYLFCKNDVFFDRAKHFFDCWLEKTKTNSDI